MKTKPILAIMLSFAALSACNDNNATRHAAGDTTDSSAGGRFQGLYLDAADAGQLRANGEITDATCARVGADSSLVAQDLDIDASGAAHDYLPSASQPDQQLVLTIQADGSVALAQTTGTAAIASSSVAAATIEGDSLVITVTATDGTQSEMSFVRSSPAEIAAYFSQEQACLPAGATPPATALPPTPVNDPTPPPPAPAPAPSPAPTPDPGPNPGTAPNPAPAPGASTGTTTATSTSTSTVTATVTVTDTSTDTDTFPFF